MIYTFITDEFRWLSNFYPCTIEFDNMQFKSVEHAYMSAKSNAIEWKEFCMTEDNPAIVKRRSYEINIDPDWDMRKVDVMRTCITKKFTQEPFRSMLLNTGTEYIQEGNYWGDRFWGIDLNINRSSKSEQNYACEIAW